VVVRGNVITLGDTNHVTHTYSCHAIGTPVRDTQLRFVQVHVLGLWVYSSMHGTGSSDEYGGVIACMGGMPS
jgi:hypothetical protein